MVFKNLCVRMISNAAASALTGLSTVTFENIETGIVELILNKNYQSNISLTISLLLRHFHMCQTVADVKG